MNKIKIQLLACRRGPRLALRRAQAQDNIFKVGAIRYTTNSKTNGIQGVGVPPGADAETGDATTLLLTYERALTPNIGVELVIGVPPKISAKATGTVAFLGDDVLSAKNVAPTLLVNYHFGAPGDAWRPYVGAGINYTKFVEREVQARARRGDERLDRPGRAGSASTTPRPRTGACSPASPRCRRKSKLVAAGTTVLTTEIDFRPTTYSFGVSYRF